MGLGRELERCFGVLWELRVQILHRDAATAPRKIRLQVQLLGVRHLRHGRTNLLVGMVRNLNRARWVRRVLCKTGTAVRLHHGLQHAGLVGGTVQLRGGALRFI
jgi:hypothetical protein